MSNIIYKFTDKHYQLKSTTLDVDAKSRRVKNAFNKVGILDSDKDIIEEGAFSKTISERGPNAKNLIWHLTDHVSSLKYAVAKFQELYVDKATGYLVGVTDIRKTSWGDDVLEFYQTGDINQHSIGFAIEKKEVINDNDYANRYTIIKEVKLYEGSSVLWGANEFTPNLSVGKSGLNEHMDEQAVILSEMEKLAKWLRKGDFTDETCELIEYRIMQLKTKLQAIFDSNKKSTEPVTIVTVQPETEMQKALLTRQLQLLNAKFN